MLKLKLQYFGHLIHRTDYLKRPWCWERLKVGGEGDNREWDGWMASPTQWTWVWVDSGSWWWTGWPGVLQSMGLQKVGNNWATKLNWTCFSTVFLITLSFLCLDSSSFIQLTPGYSSGQYRQHPSPEIFLGSLNSVLLVNYVHTSTITLITGAPSFRAVDQYLEVALD